MRRDDSSVAYLHLKTRNCRTGARVFVVNHVVVEAGRETGNQLAQRAVTLHEGDLIAIGNDAVIGEGTGGAVNAVIAKRAPSGDRKVSADIIGKDGEGIDFEAWIGNRDTDLEDRR